MNEKAQSGGKAMKKRAKETRGFTLVELLAAMAILGILALFIGRVFTESTRAVSAGSRGAQANADARTVLDFMARELSMAAADDVIGFFSQYDPLDSSYVNYDGTRSSRIAFVSLGRTPRHENQPYANRHRNAAEIVYRARMNTNYNAVAEIRRSSRYQVQSLRAYDRENWWEDGWNAVYGMEATLIGNVVEFSIVPYRWDNVGGHVPVQDYRAANEGGLPLFADIYLATLGDEEAGRADALSGVARREYIQRHARRYVTRVYFEQRSGRMINPR